MAGSATVRTLFGRLGPRGLFGLVVLVVFVLFVVGVAARVLLRRPWTIVATRDDGTEIEREVVGWRASRAQIESMRRALEGGFDV